jgi:hypothetical protein
MTAANVMETGVRLLRRALMSDFQNGPASEQERAEMAAAAPPIIDPLAQDYTAWRRAVLWTSSIVLALSSLIALVTRKSTAEQAAEAQIAALRAQADAAGQTFEGADLVQMTAQVAQGFGKDNLAVLDGLSDFLLFVKIAVVTLVILAAMRWAVIRRSRSFTRWAWLSSLLLPLLVSVWPWAQMLDFSHLNETDFLGRTVETGKVVKQQIGLALAALLMSTLVPKLIALFPGIIRSSMALKTLLPEAAAPGWLTVVFAPFLAGFLLLILCGLSQAQGSWLLMAGMLLLCVGPIFYLTRAAEIIRPHSAAEVGPVIVRIRRTTALTNAAGAVLLAIYLFDMDELSWSAALHMLLEAGGGILLTMVAISDITLALLAFNQQQAAQFQSSELRQQYERRLQSLSGAGLLDVQSALGFKDLEKLRNLRQGKS